MEKTFLQKVSEFTHGIQPDKEKNEAILVLARDRRIVCSVDGSTDDLANMLYATAKGNPAFADLLEVVVDKLNDSDDSSEN